MFFLNAQVTNQNSVYSPSYYDQFAISAGGYPFVNSNAYNLFLTEFSSNGTQLYGAYKGAYPDGVYERLIAIDAQNSRYVVKVQSGFVSNLATAGAWLTDYTNTYTGNIIKTYTLSKYDSAGNIIYTTYLPNTMGFQSYVDGDSIYLIGMTQQEIPGLSNLGVFQEHYVNYSTSSNYYNGYYVKLNGTGSKQIGSYFPTSVNARLYNGGLYFFTDISGLSASVQQSLVTPGAFQQSGGDQVLCKMNANTGTLMWGTALGVSVSNTYTTGVYTFNVNETGIYLYGTAESPVAGYYATPGAFKTQISGDSDIFLTKFNDTGNRVWGTYLGGNGLDDNWESYNFALKGNKIVVGGLAYGTDNISTTGAYLTTLPNPGGGNLFFAGFDSDGNQEFCSYYGGPIQASIGFGQALNTTFDNAGNLYLWGYTNALTGFATPDGAYPNAINPQANLHFGYLAKFTPKNGEMGTSEIDIAKDLVLNDNPNNGNFTLSGSVLAKQNCKIKVNDAAGRLITTQSLQKFKTQKISLQGYLVKGIYFINVIDEKEKNLKTFKMSVH